MIQHYETLVEDARYQVIRNEDAEKLEKKHIREENQYIARQNKLIAERTRKGLTIPDEIYGNIERSQEAIAEAMKCCRRCLNTGQPGPPSVRDGRSG